MKNLSNPTQILHFPFIYLIISVLYGVGFVCQILHKLYTKPYKRLYA